MATFCTGCGVEVRPACRCRSNAEIARLKAEVERFKRALAAGPAALRVFWGTDAARDAEIVEAAQAEAMKEKP